MYSTPDGMAWRLAEKAGYDLADARPTRAGEVAWQLSAACRGLA